MYKIVCTYAGGTVAVPTEIIDKNLKLASAASFKVLLFIFRNPEGVKDAEQVALCTGRLGFFCGNRNGNIRCFEI